MAKLLDDNDFLEIREAINDVNETFGQKEVIYKLSESYTLQRFGRDLNNASNKSDKILLGLVVFNAPDSELNIDELGKYDFSMGYVLFGWDYLETEELIIDKNGIMVPIFEPEKDVVWIDGKKYEIMGVWTGGQLKDKDSIVKIFFKNILPNG